MFELTEPRPVHFAGSTTSAPLQLARVAELGVIGTLFRGEVRQLQFDGRGDLLVLAGRGVRRLDPKTLAETGRWLADRDVLAVHPCGDRLWVITDDAIFLAAFGDELGPPFAAIAQRRHTHAAAASTRLAVPLERGVALLDAATGTTRELMIDEAWYATVRSARPPERAMLSPSGRHVGVTADHGYTVIWDADAGAPRLTDAHASASVFLDDARIIHANPASHAILDFAAGTTSQLPKASSLVREDAQVRGPRLLMADAWGGFNLHAVDTLALVAQLDGLPRHYGRGAGRVCAALSDTHVATYAATAGVLRVTEIGGATVESSDWIGGAEVLSLGQGGRRVGVFRPWANGRLDCVDLDAGHLFELRGASEDITHAAITGDGRKVVVPSGSILRARTVHVGEFGAAESTAAHATKSCLHETVTYGDDAYAVATYTLSGSGYVGLHQAGVARALAKITHGKEQPWRVAVGHGGEEILIGWDKATILYDARKRPKPVQTWDLSAHAVALGPVGFLAFQHGPDQLHLRCPGAPERVVTVPERSGHGAPRLAFSRDGALLFRGAHDGMLEVRRAEDGELLRELPLHVGSYVALQRCGEALWTLGEDGLAHVLGLA